MRWSFFSVPSNPWAAPKRPILNTVNITYLSLFFLFYSGFSSCFISNFRKLLFNYGWLMFSGNQGVLVFPWSFIIGHIIITDYSRAKGYAFRYVVYVFFRVTGTNCGVAKAVARLSKYVNSSLTFIVQSLYE